MEVKGSDLVNGSGECRRPARRRKGPRGAWPWVYESSQTHCAPPSCSHLSGGRCGGGTRLDLNRLQVFPSKYENEARGLRVYARETFSQLSVGSEPGGEKWDVRGARTHEQCWSSTRRRLLSTGGHGRADRKWLVEDELGDVDTKKGLQLLAVMRSRARPWSEWGVKARALAGLSLWMCGHRNQ